MILALAFYTAQKLAAVFAGKEVETDHRRRRIYSRANINKFFVSSMTCSIAYKCSGLVLLIF